MPNQRRRPGPAEQTPGGAHRSEPVATLRSAAIARLIDRDPTVAQAFHTLALEGAVSGARSQRVSTRVDPGIMGAAKKRLGMSNDSDVINASLAIAAAPDPFKAWWRDGKETVTDDFELAV